MNKKLNSNRLPVLAAEVRRAHTDVLDATRTAVERAFDAGKALIEAKALVGHGEWLRWLDGAGVPERTAQRYMTLASSDLKSDTVSDLGGITPALRFLKLRKRCFDLLELASAALGRKGEAFEEPLERASVLLEEMEGMLPPPSDEEVEQYREQEIAAFVDVVREQGVSEEIIEQTIQLARSAPTHEVREACKVRRPNFFSITFTAYLTVTKGSVRAREMEEAMQARSDWARRPVDVVAM